MQQANHCQTKWLSRIIFEFAKSTVNLEQLLGSFFEVMGLPSEFSMGVAGYNMIGSIVNMWMHQFIHIQVKTLLEVETGVCFAVEDFIQKL